MWIRERWDDTFVLVLPCGRSAHLELGWAVGQGKRTPESVKAALEAKDRTQAGYTAPPQGLCLMRVDY